MPVHLQSSKADLWRASTSRTARLPQAQADASAPACAEIAEAELPPCTFVASLQSPVRSSSETQQLALVSCFWSADRW